MQELTTSVKLFSTIGYLDWIPYPMKASHDGNRQRVILGTCHHWIVGGKIRHWIPQLDTRLSKSSNWIPQLDTSLNTLMGGTSIGYLHWIVPWLDTVMRYPPQPSFDPHATSFSPLKYPMEVSNDQMRMYPIEVPHDGIPWWKPKYPMKNCVGFSYTI